MPYVILEGPDRCGKTTLAQQLINLGVMKRLVHFGVPSNRAYTEYLSVIKALDNEPVIFDRFMYGELVYGPLLRRRSQLTWSDVEELERLLTSHGPVAFVVCMLTRDELHKALKTICEPLTWTPTLVDRVYDDYKEIIRTCPFPTYRYVWTQDQAYEKVIAWTLKTLAS